MLIKLNHLAIGVRLAINGALGVLALAVDGLIGMSDSASQLKSVYEKYIVAMQHLAEITGHLHASLLIMQANARLAASATLSGNDSVVLVHNMQQLFAATPGIHDERMLTATAT